MAVPYLQLFGVATDLVRQATGTQDAVNKATEAPILEGVLLKSISLTAGTTSVRHKLGRPAVGAFPVLQSVTGTVAVLGSTSEVLSIEASVAMTVNLWVF